MSHMTDTNRSAQNKAYNVADTATLRGLAEALRGEGYTEAEMRARMQARIAASEAEAHNTGRT